MPPLFYFAVIESIKEHYKTYDQPTKKMPKALFDELAALEEKVKGM